MLSFKVVLYLLVWVSSRNLNFHSFHIFVSNIPYLKPPLLEEESILWLQ